MGAMFPPSVFNERGWYQRTSGWLKSEAAKGGGVGGANVASPLQQLARVMLHRAFRVWLHLSACVAYATEAGRSFADVELGADESIDGVLVWSPTVEAAVVELVAAFADLHVLQNDTSALIVQASGISGTLPESYRKTAEAIERAINKAGKAPAWLDRMPANERHLLRRFWKSHGARLGHYRNLDQHSGVLARAATFRKGKDGPVVKVRLPDNPEDRDTQKALTYASDVDGLAVASTTFEALRELAEAFATERGGMPSPLDFNIEAVPGIEIKENDPRVIYVFDDGAAHVIMRCTPDRRLSLQHSMKRAR